MYHNRCHQYSYFNLIFLSTVNINLLITERLSLCNCGFQWLAHYIPTIMPSPPNSFRAQTNSLTWKHLLITEWDICLLCQRIFGCIPNKALNLQMFVSKITFCLDLSKPVELSPTERISQYVTWEISNWRKGKMILLYLPLCSSGKLLINKVWRHCRIERLCADGSFSYNAKSA